MRKPLLDSVASQSAPGSVGRAHRTKASGTKHAAVAEVLREEIAKGIWAAGECIPSEQQLAKRFGVAYMTARQAVSSLVSEGVLERVARKGTYVVQKRTAVPPTRNPFVLLLEGGKTSLDPYYLPPLIEALECEIQAHGFEVSVYDYTLAIREGLIPKEAVVCCVLLSEPEILYANLLLDGGNRVVAINRCGDGGRVPYVTPDNAAGAQMAVEHLIDLGHRRIGFIRGLPGNIDASDRRRGYVQALRSRGLALGPEDGDHFTEACGYEVAKRMLAAKVLPTAIFCASDLSAIGAMKAIAEAGFSVPSDISVVGFGDFPLARFWHPGLTTVHLPLPELGTSAAKAMLSLMEGIEPETRFLPCSLVVRNTTEAIPVVEDELSVGL